MKTIAMKKIILVAGGVVCTLAMSVQATGIITPLQIASDGPVYDESLQLLEGSPEAPGDLVQILEATDGVIYPPSANGQPDSRNPVVADGETAIGALLGPGVGEIGYFGATFSDSRPEDGTQLFVRIFNAPTASSATFYGDSEVFPVSENNVFLADIDQTDQPLDIGDDDGDGLNNSWERVYGTYDIMWDDSDGDGMSDADEHIAGTLPGSAASVFELSITPIQPNGWAIEWPSAPGRKYVVCSAGLDINNNFIDVTSTITAVTERTTYSIENESAERGYIRVKAIE